MINADFRLYNYFTFGEKNSYGMPSLSKEPKGQIKIALYTTSQQTQTNINYLESNYIGLTNDNVNDSYVIQMEDGKLLKVEYIQPKGRYKQVFLKNYD